MKRYRVCEEIAFVEEDGDWLSYKQVIDFLQTMVWHYLSKEEIEGIVDNYDSKLTIW